MAQRLDEEVTMRSCGQVRDWLQARIGLCRRKERVRSGHGDMDSIGGQDSQIKFEKSDDYLSLSLSMRKSMKGRLQDAFF